MIQEGLQVFLHLYGVVFHLDEVDFKSLLPNFILVIFFCMFMCCWVFGDLCNCEYSEPALSPCAMLLQQEREEHEETPVVDDPPDVNVALIISIVIT